MNKIYGLIVIFAFAGLLIPTSAIQADAVNRDLDYMLTIAEKAKKYIKHNIDEMENQNIQDWKNKQLVLDIYDKSTYEIEQLEDAIENADVKSARKLFVSSMDKLKQISLMLNQIAENRAAAALPSHSEIIKRYEMNYIKLQQFSDKLGANIDFSEMENLLKLAKQNDKQGEPEKTKQVLDQIALRGLEIHKTLQSINEENKIIRAQALAKKYIDRINSLIVQAKNTGLSNYIEQLEKSKSHLVSSNSTSEITKNIRLVITINNNLKEIEKSNLEQIAIDKIKLSQKQTLMAQLNQLETKAKLLHSDAVESNKALYFVEKALANIDYLRNNSESENKTDTILRVIEQLLSKAERIVQEST